MDCSITGECCSSSPSRSIQCWSYCHSAKCDLLCYSGPNGYDYCFFSRNEEYCCSVSCNFRRCLHFLKLDFLHILRTEQLYVGVHTLPFFHWGYLSHRITVWKFNRRSPTCQIRMILVSQRSRWCQGSLLTSRRLACSSNRTIFLPQALFCLTVDAEGARHHPTFWTEPLQLPFSPRHFHL